MVAKEVPGNRAPWLVLWRRLVSGARASRPLLRGPRCGRDARAPESAHGTGSVAQPDRASSLPALRSRGGFLPAFDPPEPRCTAPKGLAAAAPWTVVEVHSADRFVAAVSHIRPPALQVGLLAQAEQQSFRVAKLLEVFEELRLDAQGTPLPLLGVGVKEGPPAAEPFQILQERCRRRRSPQPALQLAPILRGRHVNPPHLCLSGSLQGPVPDRSWHLNLANGMPILRQPTRPACQGEQSSFQEEPG